MMAWRDRRDEAPQFPHVVEAQRKPQPPADKVTVDLMLLDAEVAAIHHSVVHIGALPAASAARVLEYLNQRFGRPYKFDEGTGQ